MELVPYSLEEATITTLQQTYMDIEIPPDDKAAYAMVMSGLRECREIRLACDEWHKENKAWILKAGRHYDAEKKRVHGLIEPIENRLKSVRQAEDNRIEAIKQAAIQKEQDRVQAIRDKIEAIRLMVFDVTGKTADELSTMYDSFSSRAITEDEFQEFTPEATQVFNETLAALSKAKADRETWEKEEADRKAESERLAQQKAEQEAAAAKIKAEQEAIEAEKRKLQEEKDQIEREKKAERERKDREEFERKAREEARIQAEKDAKEAAEKADAERKEREAREAKEAEEKAQREAAEKARQEALRPNKEKLILWANSILDTVSPELSDIKAREIANRAIVRIYEVAHDVIKEAEGL